MKRITIGRGHECDVRLQDSTDLVSRRQAVITFTLFGKMEIYDTSSNGTYVNGEKVEKPDGKPVRRGDQVNFAHIVDLDWSKVHDPYRKIKISVVAILVAIVAVVAVALFVEPALQQGSTPDGPVQSVTPVEDTIIPPQPQEVPPAFYKNDGPDVGTNSTAKKDEAAIKESKEKTPVVETVSKNVIKREVNGVDNDNHNNDNDNDSVHGIDFSDK